MTAESSIKIVGPKNAASFCKMLSFANWYDYILLASGIIFSICGGALAPFNSIIFRGITNTLLNGQSQWENGTFEGEIFQKAIYYYVWMYVYIAVIIMLCAFIAMISFYTLCERQITHIRTNYLKSILKQDMAWFNTNETGKLTTTMSSGIEKIRAGMSDKLGVLIQSVTHLCVGICVGFFLNYRIASFMIFVAPILMISFWWSGKLVKKAASKESDAYGAAGAVADEVLNGIKIVMAFNAQQFELERYEKLLQRGVKMGIKKAYLTAIFGGIFFGILFISMAVVFWFGIKLIQSEGETLGTLFAVFWSVMVGSIRLGQNITQISAIVSAKLAGGEIFDVIEREPEIDCCSSVGEQPRHFQGNIAFSNVTFRYPSRPTQQILNEISFEVKANTQVALVGSSGSGKSTVMTLLMKYYNVESGSITLDGKPIQDLNIKWLRQMIAIVPQGSVLFTASIRDNIKIGKIDATDEEVIEACKTAHAHDFIMKLPYQYDTMVGEGGISLSGGQAQRVQIAKAVIRSSRILLLDEATSALDSESESIVQKALDAASKGRTTIAIAHRLSTIRNYDNIVVFKEGDIIEIGNHDELMKNKGYYHSLILAQQTQERNVDNGCDEKSLASTKTEYNERSIDGAIEESEEDDAQISRERLSKRLGRSMVSVKSIDDEEDENVRDSMHDIGASEATIMDIIKFGKRDFKIAAFGLIFVIGRGLTWPVFSIIYGNLFKTLSNPDNSEDANKLSIIFICSAFAVLGICSMIFTIAAGTMFGISGERMTKRLRVAVYKNILSQDASYFDSGKHSVSTLSNRLASDAPNVQAAIDMRLAEVLQGVVSLIAGLIISFVYGWRMAFVGIGTALTLLVVNVSTSNLLKRRAMEDSHTAERASQIALESIENVKTIQDMTFHDDVMHMFHKASEEPMRRAIIRGYLQAFSYSFSLAFVSFNFAVSYSIGTILIVNNYVTPYVVFQVIEALNMASMSLMNAASYFPEYVRARCSAGLLFKMISEKSSIDNFGKGGNTKKIHGNIQIESAHFAYPHMPRQKVLKNLSINVDFGQTLALCGPSGSGKSTTIQLLERYYDLSVGEVLIDNINIKHYNVNHLRKAISIVSQQPILFNLTVKQNICYGSCGMSDDEVVEAARNANIADFIETLPQKYNTYIGPRGRNLSLGQAQRLSIARAIIRQPRILLLDEPSASLDAASEKVVQEALDKASRGRTCVVIAHRLKTIEKADCIGVIADGRVQEMGEHHQLLDHKGIYYNLAKQQTL